VKLKDAMKLAAVKYQYYDVLAKIDTSIYFYKDGYGTPEKIRNNKKRYKPTDVQMDLSQR